MPIYNYSPMPRLRRLRCNANIRELIRETTLNVDDLVLPLFIRHGHQIKKAIASMPGHYQWSVDRLEEIIPAVANSGVKRVILFGIPETKDAHGQDSYVDHGVIQTAIPVIKKLAPQFLIFSDLCLCEYTDHGHCGVIKDNEVHNDETLALLAKQAVSHAKAGADVLAPSGMMDGVIKTIRHALDTSGYEHLPILSYAAKYASSMYGPFREAAEGAPKFGDRRAYQMDYANSNEALRECALDVEEGDDMLMIKPAHTYLDVISRIKQAFPELPLAAYHTSGEFAMIKAAAEKGWIDERSAVLEVLTSIRRAGADFIFTYFAQDVGEWLRGS